MFFSYKDDAVIGYIYKENPANDRDHFYLYGIRVIDEGLVKGIFVGFNAYGKWVGGHDKKHNVNETDFTVELKLNDESIVRYVVQDPENFFWFEKPETIVPDIIKTPSVSSESEDEDIFESKKSGFENCKNCCYAFYRVLLRIYYFLRKKSIYFAIGMYQFRVMWLILIMYLVSGSFLSTNQSIIIQFIEFIL